MPTTAKYGLPYPALSDAPNIPLITQNLANAVDALGVIGGKRQTSAGATISTVETIVIDTQTLALAASSVFRIEFDLYFTATVAGNDIRMRIRTTSISGTELAQCSAYGVYVAPEVSRGRLSYIYKTTTAAELVYFAGTIIRIGSGTSTLVPVAPTSMIVTNIGPSTIIGDY